MFVRYVYTYHLPNHSATMENPLKRTLDELYDEDEKVVSLMKRKCEVDASLHTAKHASALSLKTRKRPVGGDSPDAVDIALAASHIGRYFVRRLRNGVLAADDGGVPGADHSGVAP